MNQVSTPKIITHALKTTDSSFIDCLLQPIAKMSFQMWFKQNLINPKKISRTLVLTLIALNGLYLTGCATYHAQKLAQSPSFATASTINLQAIQPFPRLAAYPFNPDNGLDSTEIQMLAVSQNPALRLARQNLGVVQAQAYAAGLLPDPQLTFAHDLSYPSISQPASGYGLNYDFTALLLHSSAKQSANATTRQTQLDLLWQEWQVIGQAQVLMIRAQMQAKTLTVLQQQQTLLTNRARRSSAAMQQGNITRDLVNLDTVAVQAINNRIQDQQVLSLATCYDLNELLGLAADTQLNLRFDDLTDSPPVNHAHDVAQNTNTPAVSPRTQPLASFQAIDPKIIQQALQQLPERRPDLLALQAGYASQDAKLRQAILAQFPALNIGLSHASDSGGLQTQSIGISLSLPIFNRNRGNIAIEEATRTRMQTEYQMRLNQTYASVVRLQAEQKQQLNIWQNRLNAMQQLQYDVNASRPVAVQGLVDDVLWINLNNNLFNQKLDLLLLEQSIREQQAGLNILLGLPSMLLTSTEAEK